MDHIANIAYAAIGTGLLVSPVARAPRLRLSWRKVGGLYHWRVGRLGGSFYIAKR